MKRPAVIHALVVGLVLGLGRVGSAADPPAEKDGSNSPRSESIVVLRPRGLAVEDGQLLEALRIYSQDVDCRLIEVGEAPMGLGKDEIETVAREAREAGAHVAVWVSRRDDGQTLYYLLDIETLELRETELEPLGAGRAAETVALKVRTLLSERAKTEKKEATETAKPSAGKSPPADEVLPPQNRSSSPVAKSKYTPARPSPRFHRFELGASYGVFVPTDTTWFRHGLLLHAEIRFQKVPLSIFVDGAITTHPDSTSSGFDVTLVDVPLGIGMLVRWQRSRIELAGGPRASLHIYNVNAAATSGAPGGSSYGFAAGLGAAGRLEVRLWEQVRAFVWIFAEGLVPNQKFTLAGAPGVNTGSFLFGSTLGVSFLIP